MTGLISSGALADLLQPDEGLARHFNRPAFVWRGDLLAGGMGVKGLRFRRVVAELAGLGTTDLVVSGPPWSNAIRIAVKAAQPYGLRVHAVIELDTEVDSMSIDIGQGSIRDMVRQVERLVASMHVAKTRSGLPIGIQARGIARKLNDQPGIRAVIADDLETSRLWAEGMQHLAGSIWRSAQRKCAVPAVVTPVGGGALLWALMMAREHLGMDDASIIGYSVTYDKTQLRKRFKAFEYRAGIVEDHDVWAAGTTRVHSCPVENPGSTVSAEMNSSSCVPVSYWDPVYHRGMLERLPNLALELEPVSTPVIIMTGVPQYDRDEFKRKTSGHT